MYVHKNKVTSKAMLAYTRNEFLKVTSSSKLLLSDEAVVKIL